MDVLLVLLCVGPALSLKGFRTVCESTANTFYSAEEGTCYVRSATKASPSAKDDECTNVGINGMTQGRLMMVANERTINIALSINGGSNCFVGLLQEVGAVEPAGGWGWYDSQTGGFWLDAHINWNTDQPTGHVGDEDKGMMWSMGAMDDCSDSGLCEFRDLHWSGDAPANFVIRNDLADLTSIHTLSTIAMSATHEQCAHECAIDPRCAGYTIDSAAGRCDLLETYVAVADKMVTGVGSQWFARQ